MIEIHLKVKIYGFVREFAMGAAVNGMAAHGYTTLMVQHSLYLVTT